MAKDLLNVGRGPGRNYYSAELLLGGRLLGFFARVSAYLLLVVVKILPLALHWRLQHDPIRGAAYAEDRKNRNDNDGQNPHTWPM